MDKAKVYFVIDKLHSEIEYKISVERIKGVTIYKLIYGNNFVERLVNTIVIMAADNGNEIIFDRYLGRELQYNIFSEIRILTSFISKYDKNLDSEYYYTEAEILNIL